MGYITREYLSTQFNNFATRIATVFAKKTEIPAKVSDLNNDAGFITAAVDNLVNYYSKAQTYTKEETASLIASISTMTLKKVDTLPTAGISTTTIYLVPKTEEGTDNKYFEYIYVDGVWELIGETETNLEGYVTDESLTAALASYVRTSVLDSYLKTADTETSNIDFSTFFSQG